LLLRHEPELLSLGTQFAQISRGAASIVVPIFGGTRNYGINNSFELSLESIRRGSDFVQNVRKSFLMTHCSGDSRHSLMPEGMFVIGFNRNKESSANPPDMENDTERWDLLTW
jgi:hypothetical protein